jgi:hypothetical protein
MYIPYDAMIQRQRPSLAIRDLPARPRAISDDDLAAVFGGCKQEDEKCERYLVKQGSDCCEGLHCEPNGYGIAKCRD